MYSVEYLYCLQFISKLSHADTCILPSKYRPDLGGRARYNYSILMIFLFIIISSIFARDSYGVDMKTITISIPTHLVLIRNVKIKRMSSFFLR